MFLFKYRNNFIRYIIYMSCFLLGLFLLVGFIDITDSNDIISNEVVMSLIEEVSDNTNIHVEYPRFKDDDINKIITDYLYGYVKKFKNHEENKVLDITYELYYFDNYVNIVFNIENTLNNIKNKNLFIDFENKKIGKITSIYDKNYLKNEINKLVYYKYSESVYDKIKDEDINSFTYIMNESKIDIYFNDIDFGLDYIPFIRIKLDDDVMGNTSVNKDQKYIVFTYDDGPSEYTNELLKTLEYNESSATFFMVGNRMKNKKDVVLEVYNSNSEIGTHTYSHKDLKKITEAEMDKEIEQASSVFNSITGGSFKYLRPPYGNYNNKIFTKGLGIVTWNIDPKDWLVKDSTKVYNEVVKHACDGCIVLMHDSYKTTIEATKMLIPKLNEMGYKVVSLSELIELKGYEIPENKVISSVK